MNCRDANGWSGLYWAVRRGHDDIVMFLLSLLGTDINMTSYHGDTALHLAAWRNRVEMVRVLLERRDIRLDIQTYRTGLEIQRKIWQ